MSDPKKKKHDLKIATPKGIKKKNKSNMRTSYENPTAKFVDWVNGLGFEKTLFGKLAHRLDKNFEIRNIAYVFLFCLSLSFLIHYETSPVYTSYREGDIASVDVKSPLSFEMVDEIETAAMRVEAEDSVPPILDFDTKIYEELLDRIGLAFRSMRAKLGNKYWPKNEYERDKAVGQFLKNKSDFEEILGPYKISDSSFQWLSRVRFSSRYANYLIRLLEPVSRKKVIQELRPFENNDVEQVIIRSIEGDGSSNATDEFSISVKEIVDVASVKKQLARKLLTRDFKISVENRRQLLRLSRDLVVANLSTNMQETAARKQGAREAVPESRLAIKKGQIIIASGSPIQAKHIVILNKIRNLQDKKRTDVLSILSASFLLLLLLVTTSFVRKFGMRIRKIDTKDIYAMGVISFLVIAISKLMLFVTDAALVREMGYTFNENFFLYLAPTSAGAMMLALLVHRGELIWFFSLFMAVVVSFLSDFSYPVALTTFIGGMAAARFVHKCKKRNDVYIAGVGTGLINLLSIFFLSILIKSAISYEDLFLSMGAGFSSGILASLLSMMIVPLLESVFNYTTDVRLLELSNLNHPLLKEMLLKAPGTYHHSIIVGTMAESAAEEIGANSLLSKVGAFYHDIGKTNHAEYFIENQRKGYNPHDNISTHMSKTILIAHVKDGAEMAAKYQLGKPIKDIILQHHGTTLISYFYNKAKELEDDINKVSEEEFRYPGPKPQFREAGLVMLADSIEAAARSLEDPTPARLQNIVRNIIQNKFLDGQLEDCNLTLRDLSVIERIYERILLTIYHQRMEYPVSMGGVDADSKKNIKTARDT